MGASIQYALSCPRMRCYRNGRKHEVRQFAMTSEIHFFCRVTWQWRTKTLRSLSILPRLLAFVSIVNAQGSYVINSISISSGNTTYQGAPVSSEIKFTEGNGFEDAVGRCLT